jgi:hypothetical protein
MSCVSQEGSDYISPIILKELADETSPLLQLIYTKSLDTGEVLADWRTANVSPVYKKGLKSAAENYRLILWFTLSKALAKSIISMSV